MQLTSSRGFWSCENEVVLKNNYKRISSNEDRLRRRFHLKIDKKIDNKVFMNQKSF